MPAHKIPGQERSGGSVFQLLTSNFILLTSLALSAQTAAPPAAPQPRAGAPARRPVLFLREEWKQNDKGDEHPVTQDSVANPSLELKLYGASGKELQVTGKAGDENNPIHIWSGNCTSPCALALRDKANFADVRWMKLDSARVVTTGVLLEKVDLSKVDEIGWADLMPGSGHGPGGWVDVAQIEVYARAVPRSSASQ